MSLGARQRETLAWYARLLRSDPETVSIHVAIGPFQRFTREQGGGRGHPLVVRAFESYATGRGELREVWLMRRVHIATVKDRAAAERKAREIVDWLVAQGCDPACIHLDP